MHSRISTVLLLLLLSTLIKAQQVSTGVSYPLALERQARISQLTYQLRFELPAEKTTPIQSTATISFDLRDATTALQLDFRQDSSHVQSLTVNGRAAGINLQNEHLVVPPSLLLKGHNSIRLDFIAGNESLNRNNDYLYALFVPDRARTVFPCFDQPDLKARFLLTLVVPAGWSVLANAILKDSIAAGASTTYTFNATDPLPTYLFSFTAGKYSVANKAGMRFLYRETDTTRIRLSVDSVFRAHQDAIHFLENWTGIQFPFQKVGFVGIPAFQFGGMEHPGEVQYNAPALFLDEGATKDQLIARSSVISHETAHMWFGDMVTMKWFNDVWMKEVFANFMADKVTQQLLGQETFDLKFLLDHTPAAYAVDRTRGANPIRQQLNNLQDAGSLYGNIIYHKAPIMMRQLELLMGKENFRKGVQEYLQQYRYGNARWDDLIAILSKHSKEDLLTWNKVWVNRPGRPVFTFQYAGKQLIIHQKPEQGTAAVWPEQFAVTLIYPDSITTLHLNMKTATITIPVAAQPDHVLFNADGMGYGLFPAFLHHGIYQLQNPLQRAAAFINAYENMLAGRGIAATDLMDFLIPGLEKETNELNLRLISGYTANLFWNFLSPEQRRVQNNALEQACWTAMQNQTAGNNKKILFKIYQDIGLSDTATHRLYRIWQNQQAPDGVKLTEDDYTALALTIALKTDTAVTVLPQQLARISNPDRKARLQFLLPALSPDTAERDRFFVSLQEVSHRRKEAWVTAALSYMNHPLRQQSALKFLPQALTLLEEIQRTGDIFFPQNWLGAIFSNYRSNAAWQVVDHFLQTHPHYNPKLSAKILQATDNLYRNFKTTAMSHPVVKTKLP